MNGSDSGQREMTMIVVLNAFHSAIEGSVAITAVHF